MLLQRLDSMDKKLPQLDNIQMEQKINNFEVKMSEIEQSRSLDSDKKIANKRY